MNSKWKITLISATVLTMLAGASIYQVSADPVPDASSSQVSDEQPFQTSSGTAAGHAGQGANQTSAQDEIKMDLAAENEFLALYFNPETTEIAVRIKKDGSVWFSNPQAREQDGKASGFNKAMLSSQLLLSYSDSSGKPQQYNNFSQSVQYQQFVHEKLEDGIKITYTVGEKLRGVEQVPPFIGEERFQMLILDKIQDEKVKSDMLNRFKLNEKKKAYERRDKALNGMGLTRTLEVFKEVGYTEEEMNIDRQTFADGEIASHALFVLPITYRLVGDQFVVQVSTEEVDTKGYYLQNLSVLPYFGAAGTNEDGYMFVPDGSGSLIRLNNGKLDAAPYNEELYGIDLTRENKFKPLNGDPARLPVFGMKKNDQAYLAIIEDGDGIGRVEADISGRANSYNSVYSSYAINISEPLTLSGNWTTQTVSKFQAESYHGNLTIRYGFLNGEQASYVGMASLYRSYLADKYKLAKLESKAQSPFFVELIGGVPKQKFFLGIPYTSYEPLTTFEQAQEILKELKGGGLGSIKLRYTGWFNGGIHHSIPTSISVDGELGGKKALNKLITYSNNNGVELYPDASFTNVLRETWGFSPRKQASRTITNSIASIYPYDLAGYFKQTWLDPAYVLSPLKLEGIVDDFYSDFKKLDLSALSLNDMGNTLNSDYNPKHMVTREGAKQIVQEQLAKLGANTKLMVSGGNSYAIPYADSVINAPVSSSGYNITDQSVPFYEIALHGYVDYAGTALNLGDDQDIRSNMLKAMETGSNLNFKWFYAKSSSVKETEFDYLYSAQYKNWINEATAAYNEVDAVLGKVRTQTIKDHEMLEKGVYRTTYEDGTTVVVNYNDYAINVEGDTVEPLGYLIGGERK